MYCIFTCQCKMCTYRGAEPESSSIKQHRDKRKDVSTAELVRDCLVGRHSNESKAWRKFFPQTMKEMVTKFQVFL